MEEDLNLNLSSIQSNAVDDCINSQNSGEYLVLLNKVNEINHEIENISINDINFLKRIEEWRIESHDIINKFCTDISNEHISRTKQDINYLRDLTNLAMKNLNKNKNNDYIYSMKKIIKLIEENLDQLKSIECELHPLEIDKSIYYLPHRINHSQSDSLQNLNELSSVDFNNQMNSSLSSITKEQVSYRLSLSPKNSFFPYTKSPKHVIDLLSDNWFTLASNETYLLTIGKSNLYLFDQSYKIVHRRSFSKEGIKDICWSKTLEKFIFISTREIFTFDDKTMLFSLLDIYFTNDHSWERGTCSETSLFVSTFGENPMIAEFYFHPSIHFHKRYQSEILYKSNEIINDIKYSNNHLALIIENGLINKSHIELRSLKSFERIWIISLGQGWGYRNYAFNNRYWIVIDKYNHQIIYILNDGAIVKTEYYLTKPFNLVYWHQDKLVIKTMKTLYIHECE